MSTCLLRVKSAITRGRLAGGRAAGSRCRSPARALTVPTDSSTTAASPPARSKGQAAGLDAGQVEDVVDQREQVLAALQDLFHLPGLALGQRLPAIVEPAAAKPMMEFIGVRSSWLIDDRNSVLARLAWACSAWAASSSRVKRACSLMRR